MSTLVIDGRSLK